MTSKKVYFILFKSPNFKLTYWLYFQEYNGANDWQI